MRFNIFFTIRGPAGTVEAPNNTNPIESESLARLLGDLSKDLPGNKQLGLETLALRIELVAEDRDVEFDPTTGGRLTGKTEPCCECGELYDRADLILRGDLYCPACRAAEAARVKQPRTG